MFALFSDANFLFDAAYALVVIPGAVVALVCAVGLGYLRFMGRSSVGTGYWFAGFVLVGLSGLGSAAFVGAEATSLTFLSLQATTHILSMFGLVLLVFGLCEHLGYHPVTRLQTLVFCTFGVFVAFVWAHPTSADITLEILHVAVAVSYVGAAIFCLFDKNRRDDHGLRFVSISLIIMACDLMLGVFGINSPLIGIVAAVLSMVAIAGIAMGFGLILLRSQEILTAETARSLRFTEDRFRLALQGASDGVWDWDFTQSALFVTDRVVQIMGSSGGHQTLNPRAIEGLIHSQDIDRYKSAIRDVLKGHSDALSVEFRIRPMEIGITRWAHTRGVAIRDPKTGLILRMAGTVTDITERKQFERELIKAKEEAELASRSKTEFLAHMSHELRTPLNAIIGFSDMMKQEVFGPIGNERYADYNATVNMAGRHLLQIISDIIDLGKIESGQTRLDDTLCDLEEISEACVQLVVARARDERLQLIKNIDPTTPWLRGDAIRIKQIILNLLTNSIKFTNAGGSVELTLDRVEDSGVRIRVRDTGIGIAQKDIPRALSRFGRLGSPYTRDEDGMGLGLTLVQTFARMHDAEFALESEVGQGTMVTVIFPADRTVERQGTEGSEEESDDRFVFAAQ